LLALLAGVCAKSVHPHRPAAGHQRARSDPRPFPRRADWYDVTEMGPWKAAPSPTVERTRWFARLPAEAQKKVRADLGVSQDSAGMMFRFKTNATTIWAHLPVGQDQLACRTCRPPVSAASTSYARDEAGHGAG